MNTTLAALNVLAVVVLASAFLLPRLRERAATRVDVPPAIRPMRPGQELSDVVTEWAKITGVLNKDGSVAAGSSEHVGDTLTEETVERPTDTFDNERS